MLYHEVQDLRRKRNGNLDPGTSESAEDRARRESQVGKETENANPGKV